MKKIPRDLDEGTIRRIDWFELIPAVQIPRAFRVATGFHPMWAGTIGVLLSVFFAFSLNVVHQDDSGVRLAPQSGEAIAEEIIAEQLKSPGGDISSTTLTRKIITKPSTDNTGETGDKVVPYAADEIATLSDLNISSDETFRVSTLQLPTFEESFSGIIAPWRFLSDVITQFIPPKSTFAGNARSLLWMFLMIVLWTFIGGAITRTAALQLTIGRYERCSQIYQFLNKHWKSYIGALAVPLFGIVFCATILSIAGLLFQLPVLNYIIAVCFPVLLLLGFVISLLGIGLLFAWPLMFAAISVDGSDAFDAVSRSYSYIFQRPLHYLFYFCTAALLGMVGWFFIAWLIDFATYLAVSWCGVPYLNFAAMQLPIGTEYLQKVTPYQRIVLSWSWCFQLTKVGFLFSYFWTSSTLVYLLLRRSVDGTPFDQVKLGKEQGETEPLPPIQQDESGAPEILKT
ncbi:MAG: hypothetical protein ACRC10_01980 [Thermoguttaceae bacterium]